MTSTIEYTTAALAGIHSQTENGALSHESTGSARLNFFFKVLRDTKDTQLVTLLENAHKENIDDTIKLVFQLRDSRGGKGERKQFLQCIRWYANNGYTNEVINLLGWIPFYGRWKDLLELLDVPQLQHAIYTLFSNVLQQDKTRYQNKQTISLAAKWAPTENGEYDKKYKAATKLAKQLGVTLKQYRKTFLAPLRSYSNTTEVYMCSQNWTQIQYQTVASICMHKHKKTFAKHDPKGFQQYLELVKSGKQHINAGQLFPHTLVNTYLSNGYFNSMVALDPTTEAQWVELVQYCKLNQDIRLGKALAICDVSGSMACGTGPVKPMTACIALGLLIAELADPPFGNQVLTFHSDPKFCLINGETLQDRVRQISQMPWGMSTDLQKTFALILQVCKKHKLQPQDCPTTIFIFSDMQFNAATGDNTITNYDAIKQMYSDAGYTIPKIVFWNLNGTTIDFPTTSHTQDTALISGFNPSLMKLFIQGKPMTPFTIMRDTIDVDRYLPIQLTNPQPCELNNVYYQDTK